jgi:hypothetical protein
VTLAQAILKVRRLARTTASSHDDDTIMARINDAMKEFGRAAFGLTKEGYVTITPLFDLQTNCAINLTIVGGANEIEATDIAICATSAVDQTGTQAAAALQTAIQAAITAAGGTPSLTVAWSTTEWTFTIDAIDSTTITIAVPDGLLYSSALELLGLGAETTTGTSVTGSIPTDCTVESALPTDFLQLVGKPEWDGDPLVQGIFQEFHSPESTGDPLRYYIRNKNIMLSPAPHMQKKFHLYYRYIPTAFSVSHGYQECGLSGKALNTSTGLSATTQYYLTVTIDGGAETEYSITTASDLTYEYVIDLLNDAIPGVTFSLVDGDLRCTSNLLGGNSAIVLAAGSSGTDLFATLTDFDDFEDAVASEAGDDLPIDDEWCEAVTYKAASVVAEENYETTLSDRYYAQFKRITGDFVRTKANNNSKIVLYTAGDPVPEITFNAD